MRAGHDEPVNLPPRVLFEGPNSGTGIPCDWSDAKELSAHTQLVLAGGLNADNVAAALASVRPFGVDVSSGVEQQPGVKSIARIAAFVAAARATAQEKSA
jgi:phosphoribosylanthranilate isomerase